jgi:hypothetical protein
MAEAGIHGKENGVAPEKAESFDRYKLNHKILN